MNYPYSKKYPSGEKPNTIYTHNDPISFQAKLISFILKSSGLKNRLLKDFEKYRINRRKAKLPKSIEKKFNIQTHQINGFNIWKITAGNLNPEKTIVYLHGGAYVNGLRNLHWRFIKELLQKTNATIIIPDYPLAPEYTAANVYSFMDNTLDWIYTFSKPSNLILLGDSAGGGLALGHTQKLKNENKPLPAQLVLLSPWLDITLSNPEVYPIEKKDPILPVNGLQMAGRVYSGDWSIKDSRVSPIYGDFMNLPPVSIFIGTHDVLFADAEKLKTLVIEKQIPINFYVYPKLFHDWPIIYAKMKESQLFFHQLIALLKS